MRFAAFLVATLIAFGADQQWEDAILRGRELQHAGRYAEAESLLTAALKKAEVSNAGPMMMARSLSALGSVYQDLGRLAEAENAYLRAMESDPEFIEPINGLASLYFDTRQLAKAETLTLRCLAVDERNGGEHLVIAQDMGNLAVVYQMERRYREAEELFLRAIESFEANGGATASSLATILHNFGALRFETGKPQEAAQYVERALAIWEQTLGRNHPIYAQGLAHLAYVDARIGQRAESERLWKQSLATLESTVGRTHPAYVRLARAYRHRRARTANPEQYTVDYRDLVRQ
jgi:tetratricopeptide (TPR) repeat protein